MRRRALASAITDLAFHDHKIALVSGPRQCGKTTLAKMLLGQRPGGVYHNWDEVDFRRQWARDPSAILPSISGSDVPLVVLDEIHKDRRWKRTLKGLYDTRDAPCDIVVTGSARLDVYRKGGDSLLGRHYAFRLHPFSLRELERPDVLAPDSMLDALFSRADARTGAADEALAALLAYGPFPEPLLAQDARRANRWRHAREQLVIREDLRDLSRLPELGRIQMMTALLPERVGSLFSLASLGRDLEASIPTIRRWTEYLKDLYYLFELKPYRSRIARTLRREGKIYLWDYGAVPAEAARFENLVAHHLLKTCHAWTEAGEGVFDLHFLRDKEQREIDFLIVRDGKPWLPVEVKWSDTEPSQSWRRFAPLLRCARGLQIVSTPEWKLHRFGDATLLVAGAAEALGYFA